MALAVLPSGRYVMTSAHDGSRAGVLVNWVQPAYANRHVIIRNDSEIRRVSLEAK